jgi:hypothetical protein
MQGSVGLSRVTNPYHYKADLDPSFRFNADPDPDPDQSDDNLRPLVYSTDPPRFRFEPPHLPCE